MSLPAPVVSDPTCNTSETIDFLRRLASMMSGGRNAEMLLEAAEQIETFSRRALTAEQLCHTLQNDIVSNAELHQVAEIASDQLMVEVDTLKAELADATQRADDARADLTEEIGQLRALAQDAQARLAIADAENAALRELLQARNAAQVAVPIHTLRLARAQFSHLAHGFAERGDLISQTICEIGACAIDQALAGHDAGETLELSGSRHRAAA